jgi:hypothetical protein
MVLILYEYDKLLLITFKGDKPLSRKWKWIIACMLFLLLLNGFGILAVQLFGR